MEKPVDKKEKGWARIYRSIQEHWLWEEKPFAYGQAWMDLILLAQYEKQKFALKRPKKIITVPRGAVFTSETKLAERWGWSRKKVHTFLKLLEEDQMIGWERNGKSTVIKLLNYGLYQYFSDDEEQKKNSKSTVEEPYRHRTSTVQEQYEHTFKESKESKESEEVLTLTPGTASFPSRSLPSWAADLAVRPVVVSDLDELVLAGASPELIRWAASKAASKGKGWAYARGIVRNSMERGMRTPPPGNPQPSSRPSYDPEEFDRRGFDLPPLPGMEEDTDEHFGH